MIIGSKICTAYNDHSSKICTANDDRSSKICTEYYDHSNVMILAVKTVYCSLCVLLFYVAVNIVATVVVTTHKLQLYIFILILFFSTLKYC